MFYMGSYTSNFCSIRKPTWAPNNAKECMTVAFVIRLSLSESFDEQLSESSLIITTMNEIGRRKVHIIKKGLTNLKIINFKEFR